MHGPQALVNTVAPSSSSTANCPSRLMVSKIMSDPGETQRRVFISSPLSSACCATSVARQISSYDELVQLPMRAALSSTG